MFYALMDAVGVVLSRGQLEEHLYGWNEPVESNAVEFLIHGLRRTLGREAIVNIRGMGWQLGTPS